MLDSHAFIWQKRRDDGFEPLLQFGTGWTLTDARYVNDRGQIRGDCHYGFGDRAYCSSHAPGHEFHQWSRSRQNITAEATRISGATVSYLASAFDTFDGSVPVTCHAGLGEAPSLGTTLVTCLHRCAWQHR